MTDILPEFSGIKKIISGGQTGADVGGLVAAERLNILTGGTAPLRWKTESGPQPILGSRFGFVQSTSPDYKVRTRLNIEDADATLIFCRKLQGGSKTTQDLTVELKKPHCVVDPWGKSAVQRIRNFLQMVNPRCLNIAGRRESKEPGIAKQVKSVLIQAIHGEDLAPNLARTTAGAGPEHCTKEADGVLMDLAEEGLSPR